MIVSGKMYRVCSQLLVKSRSITRRRMTSQTPEWEKEKVQMQYKHEEAMKRLEYEQKRGLEHLGVSRDTANLLTVGGTTVLVVSSGAWFVSQLLADTKANVLHLQREVFNQSENMRSFISVGHYPRETEPHKASK